MNALHLRQAPNDLMQNVSAQPIGNSDLVGVQATAPTAAQAQAIANEWVRQVVYTRAVALHAAVAEQLPALKAQTKSLPPPNRTRRGRSATSTSNISRS